MSDTERRVALVTGASRGIGRAIACELAAQGHDIVVNYSSQGEAAKATIEAVEAAGGKGFAFKADVGRPEQLDQLFAAVGERFGRLDVLINNAGVSAAGPLAQVEADAVDRAIEVNLKGVIFATQRAALAFGERGGAVVNVSSALVRQPIATQAVYACTKSAVETLTRALAQELGSLNIRVNAVAPGPVETDMLRIDAQTREYLEQRTALRRLGRPQDIAKVVAFLASGASGWITGEVIGVDGGLRM